MAILDPYATALWIDDIIETSGGNYTTSEIALIAEASIEMVDQYNNKYLTESEMKSYSVHQLDKGNSITLNIFKEHLPELYL